MNIFGFIGLLRQIYGKKLPDLASIQKKGLLAVKIAQHFALRIDFLDDKVCSHLTRLYQNTGYVSDRSLDGLIDSYTDGDFLDNFSSFNKVPFASASIGQVHDAVLKDGTGVIVKIIKGKYKKRFLSDIRHLRRLFRFIIFFYPKLQKVADPVGILDNIRDYTLSELDLQDEYRGQERLKAIRDEYAGRFDLSQLAFPGIHSELTSENILVAEKIRGESFDSLLRKGKLPYQKLLDFFRLHGFFLFVPGIFHGDIHPGNILLGEDGRIYLVDTGAVSTVGKGIKTGLYGFMKNLSYYDFPGCAASLNDMAEIKIDGKRFARFREKFLNLYRDFSGSTVAQVSLTRKMMETIKLGVNSGMVFEKGLFGIIKSMMYLDGMTLRCKPDVVLVEDMRKYIEEFETIKSQIAEKTNV